MAFQIDVTPAQLKKAAQVLRGRANVLEQMMHSEKMHCTPADITRLSRERDDLYQIADIFKIASLTKE